MLAGIARDAAGWPRRGLFAIVALLALIWYVDPSAVYRRIVPVPLDRVPESGLFVTLDLSYRLVIAAAFAAVVVQRFKRRPAMMLVLERNAS